MKTIAWLIALSPVLVLADEELIGGWERTLIMDDLITDEVVMDATIRFTFKPDNRFELYQNIVLGDVDLPAGDGEFEVQADTDLVIDRDLVVLGSGTYRTVADSLFLDVTEVDEILDRDSLLAILTQVGKWLAHYMNEWLDTAADIEPEDWDAYEEAVIAELIRNVEHAFFFEGDSGPVGAYRIEHGKLWIIQTWEDGTVAMYDFDRMDPATAVTSSTWGTVKRGFQQ